jgi:hypothetical protein
MKVEYNYDNLSDMLSLIDPHTALVICAQLSDCKLNLVRTLVKMQRVVQLYSLHDEPSLEVLDVNNSTQQLFLTPYSRTQSIAKRFPEERNISLDYLNKILDRFPCCKTVEIINFSRDMCPILLNHGIKFVVCEDNTIIRARSVSSVNLKKISL